MKVYRIVIFALTILVVVLALNTARLINKESTLESELEHSEFLRNLQNDQLESKLQAMSTQVENYQASINNTVTHLISQGDIQRLERRGIPNPIETIIGDLLNNHELIPDRMTPKGPFYFHREQIHIINDRWVYALYDEGHFEGELIAAYEIDAQGSISWNVIEDVK